MSLPAIFQFLLDHADLVQLLYDVISGGKTTKEAITQAIQKSIVDAADAEIAKEFPT